MTIDARCLVCKNPDRRRLVELGWNGGMSAEAIARTLDMKGLAATTVLKHLKEHADGDGNARAVTVEPERPLRDRVMALQRMQVDEFERRIAVAKERADQLNAAHANEGPDEWTPVDWSSFIDILGKDIQAAIGSILRAQGLTDKREAVRNDLKLGLFEAMVNAGLAPKALSGGKVAAPDEEDADDSAD